MILRRFHISSLEFPVHVLTPLLLFTVPVTAQQVRVIRELGHDVSAPLRTMTQSYPAVPTDSMIPEREEDSIHVQAAGLAHNDRALQRVVLPAVGTNPGLSILGVGSDFSGPQGRFSVPYAPPDANASVGATQIVETVNTSLAVFDKITGSTIWGPVDIATLWSGSPSGCASTAKMALADPEVLYDKLAGRWLIGIHTLTNPYLSCLAVSTTGDATGTYNRYAFSVSADGNLTTQDIGIWPDGYYISRWTSTSPGSYMGPEACVADRSRMLAGLTATMQCFQIQDPRLMGMLPSDLDGTTLPPAGSPNYFLVQGPAQSNSLYLFKLHADFSNPAHSTFTGPTSISVAAYTPAPPFGTPTVPQLGTRQLLDAIGGNLMRRLAYRNFPGAQPPHESLVVTHSVMVGTGSATRTGLRWYELRNPGTVPVVFQQGTFSPDTNYRWMGSMAMDKMQNIAIGYSVSGSGMYPAIRYTGRQPGDPAGALETEATIYQGRGSQMGSERWGDYNSLSVDPVDDCTMWYTGQYMVSSGSLEWATRVYSFRFQSCK